MSTHRNEAERGLVLAAGVAGIDVPKTIVWVSTPLEGAVADAQLKAANPHEWSYQGEPYESDVDRVWWRIRDRIIDRFGEEAFESAWRAGSENGWYRASADVLSEVCDTLEGGRGSREGEGWSLLARTRALEHLPDFSSEGYGEWEGYALIAEHTFWAWLRRPWVIFVDPAAPVRRSGSIYRLALDARRSLY
ncbi:MAG: hypothetical protein JWR01_1450 [Subtercola sp.]|nr:hypothetical protein [Subtercola sp.]